MKIKRISVIVVIFITLSSNFLAPALSSDLVSNPALTQDWTCQDRTFLPNGKSEVGVSYQIDPEKYLASKIGTLEYVSRKQYNSKTKQFTVTFDQVTINLEKGEWKTFIFIAAIGHTAVIVKKFPVKSTNYVQKLALKYTNSSSKIEKLELSSYFEARTNPQDPSNSTSCKPTENFDRISTLNSSHTQG